MKFLSVCSGIEAASVAWKPLGWTPWAFSEIESFPCDLLAHHYPDVPNLGDMTKFEDWPHPDESIDLLYGGTPCQSFSVAGLRKGLADPRGNLMLTFARIAAKYRPRWLVWENVPGVLSNNWGRDFASFLGLITGRRVEPPVEGWSNSGILLGYRNAYGVAWRTLDAQYFGVAQRRRRVFVIGYLGDWRRAAAVLLERHSLQGHPAPRRETRQIASALTAHGVGTCGADDNQAQARHLIAATLTSAAARSRGAGQDSGMLVASTGDIAHRLNAGGMGRQDFETETPIAHALRGEGFDASEDGTGRGTPIAPVIAFSAKDHGADAMRDLSPTLRAGGHANSHANAGVMPAVAYNVCFNDANGVRPDRPNDGLYVTEAITTPALTLAPSDTKIVEPAPHATHSTPAMAVRRLTPRECERLQGFPDDYTLIPKPRIKKIPQEKLDADFIKYLMRGGTKTYDECIRAHADGPRYKALGNSWAVPCARWIGERIAAVDAIREH